MKVRISTIPAGGIRIEDRIPLDALNARMEEGRDNEVSFTSAPRISCTINRIGGGGAALVGSVYANVLQPCALCCEKIECEIEAPLNFILRPNPSSSQPKSLNSQDSCLDDVGVAFYNEDHVDLEELVQESLILAINPFWRPSEDCNGSCTLCGKQVNRVAAHNQEKQSLAQLLQAAGIAPKRGCR